MSKELYLQLMAAFDKMKAEQEDKGFVEWWSNQRLINGYLRGEALITAEHFASRAWGNRQKRINELELMIAERDEQIARLDGRHITDHQIGAAILSKRPKDIARVRALLESK